MTLTTKKRQATVHAHDRVHAGRPPKDMSVEHEGTIYLREAWHGPDIGWGPWRELFRGPEMSLLAMQSLRLLPWGCL